MTSPPIVKGDFPTALKGADDTGESDSGNGLLESSTGGSPHPAELRDESPTEGDTNDGGRSRKRRRIRQGEDLESSYLSRLAREEAKEDVQRRAGRRIQKDGVEQAKENLVETVTSSSDNSPSSCSEDDVPLLQHETIARLDVSATLDKAARTVFLSNVSTAAIKSKSAKKILLNHLAAPLQALEGDDARPTVQSLRFRSTAFASSVGPKKAAFAKKELMENTTSSTNAYVVYSSEAAARVCASQLNGTIVLDRHLRADYAAQPSVIDHRRCVFVGNLSFVDKENVESLNDGEVGKPRRPKAKEPADAEEGLWRTFNRAGPVESVRVVRDKETRVGKGFAYVQFKDENGVEAALLSNEKKFPPMLPRKLRVMRAKQPKQTATGQGSYHGSREFKSKHTGAGHSGHGSQASRNPTTSGAGRVGGPRKQNGFVFEGHRATRSSGSKPGGVKVKKRKVVKSSTRSSRRGAAFKAAGGKRKRES